MHVDLNGRFLFFFKFKRKLERKKFWNKFSNSHHQIKAMKSKLSSKQIKDRIRRIEKLERSVNEALLLNMKLKNQRQILLELIEYLNLKLSSSPQTRELSHPSKEANLISAWCRNKILLCNNFLSLNVINFKKKYLSMLTFFYDKLILFSQFEFRFVVFFMW